MAMFAMTSDTARSKDVKHMLSSEYPVVVKFREYDGDQELNIQKRYHEQQLKPPGRFEEKFLELFVGHNIALPKAPAFWRPKSSKQLRKIISRVSTPTHNIPGRKVEDDPEDRELCRKDYLKSQQAKRAKSAPPLKKSRTMSAKEMALSSVRLSTQNKIGRLRYGLRAGQTEHYVAAEKVNNVYGDFTKL